MDKAELIIDIVFRLETTFDNLTRDECVNIFHTFPKYIKVNKNIKEAFNKYLTHHIYNTISTYVMSSSYLCLLGLQEKKTYFDENKAGLDNILAMIKQDEIRNCFESLLIAEYKEILFEDSYDSYYNNKYDMQIIDLIIDYYFNDDITRILNHKHDENHYMFRDVQYKFL